MTRDETKNIIRVIAASYPTFKPDNLVETIDVWYMMLEDQDYKLLSMALKTYIRTNNTGFAPSVGQLMECVYKFTNPNEMTPMQAWATFKRTVSMERVSCQSEQIFEKLPPIIQKTIQNSDLIYKMSVGRYNEAVESSNFMKNYQLTVEKEKELLKLSADVIQYLDQNQTLKLTE